ncbi:MAG: hypothetical protein QOC94_1229 [Actinoplanes sp.]|jgi:hypothetical protein|nr:hypothetical protein [Actinoplanes sp.]
MGTLQVLFLAMVDDHLGEKRNELGSLFWGVIPSSAAVGFLIARIPTQFVVACAAVATGCNTCELAFRQVKAHFMGNTK